MCHPALRGLQLGVRRSGSRKSRRRVIRAVTKPCIAGTPGSPGGQGSGSEEGLLRGDLKAKKERGVSEWGRDRGSVQGA